MHSTVAVDTVFEQAEQLSFEEKLLLLEKLEKSVRSQPQDEQPRQRIAGLHEGMGWMAEDFDAPLDDSFWLGEDAS